MKNVLLYILVLFSVFGGYSQSYEACINAIDKYVEKQNWEMAERMILSALKLKPADPSNFILLSNLGTVHRNMGKTEDALKDYNNALAITPNAVTLLHNRASLYLEMDSAVKAFDDYERIMRLDKSDKEALYYHGMLAMQFGELTVAEGDFNQIHALDKENLDAKRAFALLYKIKNDYQKAIGLYTEVIGKENRQSNYLSRAECYLLTNQYQEATADLIEAQKLDPTNADLYIMKASLADAQYRYDEAEAYAKEAIEFGADPESLKSFFRKKPK